MQAHGSGECTLVMCNEIVYSLWRHRAVHKRTGEEVANLFEYKGMVQETQRWER